LKGWRKTFFKKLSCYYEKIHYLGFLLAGRRPADAGLLGVLGAAVSGPVSKSAPRGVAPRFAWPLMRHARSQALSSVLPFGKNAHCPAIFAAADAAKSETPRRPQMFTPYLGLGRIAYGSFFIIRFISILAIKRNPCGSYRSFLYDRINKLGYYGCS
jgi:hypothetical protein